MSKPAISKPGTQVEAFAKVLAALPDHCGSPIRAAGRFRRDATSVMVAAREHGLAEGRAEGFDEGLVKGQEAGETKGRNEAFAIHTAVLNAEMELFREGLAETLASIDRAMETWYRESEEQLTELALDIVRKILKSESLANPMAAFEIARAAFAEVTHAASARVRINPCDHPILSDRKEELMACANSLRRLEIVEDPSITGGCVIDTDGGLIDATFEGQILALSEDTAHSEKDEDGLDEELAA